VSIKKRTQSAGQGGLHSADIIFWTGGEVIQMWTSALFIA